MLYLFLEDCRFVLFCTPFQTAEMGTDKIKKLVGNLFTHVSFIGAVHFYISEITVSVAVGLLI